eukprot:CAMPEP_0203936714 /NCGR_PEP_ID=MMETSP0359-20131031/74151_1 /ASSEMBLY_ACC=CAM_ASM_000338 /TAXON_ID=268821 /ORGANISM="Scrippsiella Hangoei, Strain SHTV-5" /LENGTH=371 /DNA_ID=CAMNT_0050866709 /DNA_START=210 /DNA_END=1322 /DNA_ORIENTATION=+
MPGEAYLRDFDWRIRNLSEADRAAFHRDGFLFIRNAFPPKPLEDILGYAQEQHFTDDGVSAVSSWAGDVWLRSNLARDFWLHSPAGQYASRILHDQAIRMRNDFITGLGYGDAGHCWHGDLLPGAPSTRQAGLSVWIPLTPVVQNLSGGSLVTANQSLLPARCLLDAKPHQVPEDCYPLVDQAGVSYDYDIGDALLFGETTWHRTQPVYKSSAGRWTWVGRMVPHYDALACGPRPCDVDQLENSSDLSFWCAPMLFPQQFPDEYQDVLRHKKSLSHEHELMEVFLKMILGSGTPVQADLRVGKRSSSGFLSGAGCRGSCGLNGKDASLVEARMPISKVFHRIPGMDAMDWKAHMTSSNTEFMKSILAVVCG